MSKGARIGREIPGLAELSAVEKIVGLRSEFQTEAFGDADSLLQNHVPVVDSRAAEAVAAGCCELLPGMWLPNGVPDSMDTNSAL